MARRHPNHILHRGKPSSQISKGKSLPIDFNQHFFFYNELFFITEVFNFIWECSQVTGNKMELKKKKKVRTSEAKNRRLSKAWVKHTHLGRVREACGSLACPPHCLLPGGLEAPVWQQSRVQSEPNGSALYCQRDRHRNRRLLWRQ